MQKMRAAQRGSEAQGRDSACSPAAARAIFQGRNDIRQNKTSGGKQWGKVGGGRQTIKIFKSGHTAAKSGDLMLFSINFFFCFLKSGVSSACSNKFCWEVSSS